jgi:transcriptional regulator with XRE-family HTH domain
MSRLDNKKIRKLRQSSMDLKGKDMLIATLAAEIGISHPILTRMENDEEYNPGVLTLLKVSEYFNVTLDDLVIKD